MRAAADRWPGIAGAALLLAGLALCLHNAPALPGIGTLVDGWLHPATAPYTVTATLYGWLPRLAVALLAGAALGAAGAVLQQVLRNPIASPLTLGVAGGAQLALSVGTLLVPAGLGALAEPVAVLGAGAALGLTVALAWRGGLEPLTLVLAGLVVSLYAGALNAALLLFFEYDLQGLLLWGGGALAQHGWGEVAFLAPRIALGLAGLVLLVRPLTLLSLGDEGVRALGLSLQRLRLLCLAVAVYLTACVVSAVGVIGFVGLAGPALARLCGARTFAQRLLGATLLGAGLLWLADQVVQPLDARLPGLLPTGAFTAVLGAPLLLWLLHRQRLPATPRTGAAPVAASARPGRRIAGLASAAAVAGLIAVAVVQTPLGWRWDIPWQVTELAPWRLPRVLGAASAGLLLALAGVLLQRLTRNPMASPEVLGISGGALAGVVALALALPAASTPALMAAGTAGGLVTVTLLLALGRRGGYAPEQLLLVGIAMKALFDGGLGMVLASGSLQWSRALDWVSGSTYGVSLPGALATLAVALLLLPVCLALHRWLDLLALGGEQAAARGLAVRRGRLVLLMLAALLTAAATLVVGPLSFVGLMAPHLASLLGLRRARDQLAGAAAIGVALMVAADWLGRQALAPYELPAGLTASLLGGLYFMWLLHRREG
ncbi:Fe(3+)-hydroxamate ABC transporter permease FhuB [Sediminicurvatus halobius]|uniref:Fe(3+)-hydroxamate ABC transporter permease FhuB n=1 Tax=Sediminicurvatus halobius TaxID=2182432 RepID=A0A2U2N983_9GAMM|nr:Fe(3+)-hydroxamate ABC transporter permease FhuB [Spiribacter halobius]PWG65726.1 Fe(3+)-hydroxamate ABC transporter permease FhuB [Spiribacter halobius]UEX77760.1 Fe(3+)-hydroxamate ABC transporter permease FhuB [Spiribacter halobius]